MSRRSKQSCLPIAEKEIRQIGEFTAGTYAPGITSLSRTKPQPPRSRRRFPAAYVTSRVRGRPAESAYNMVTSEECRRKNRHLRRLTTRPRKT